MSTGRPAGARGAYWDAAFEDPDPAPYRQLLAAALGPLGCRGARALDLGCGTGVLSRLLVEHGARRVVGVDLSATSLAVAAERARGLPVDLVRMDVSHADALGRFDLVVAYASLYYAASPREAIAAAARAVAPGGTLLLGLLERSPASRAMNVLRRVLARVPEGSRPALARAATALAIPLLRERPHDPAARARLERRVASGLFTPARQLFAPAEVARQLASLGLAPRPPLPGTGQLALSRHFALVANRPPASARA